jgi:hypothetical protein
MAGKMLGRMQWDIINKNGDDLKILTNPAYIKKNGEIIGVSITVEDITNKNQTEETLKKNNIKLERFVKLAVGREKKMKELKKRIKELEKANKNTKKAEDDGVV